MRRRIHACQWLDILAIQSQCPIITFCDIKSLCRNICYLNVIMQTYLLYKVTMCRYIRGGGGRGTEDIIWVWESERDMLAIQSHYADTFKGGLYPVPVEPSPLSSIKTSLLLLLATKSLRRYIQVIWHACILLLTCYTKSLCRYIQVTM